MTLDENRLNRFQKKKDLVDSMRIAYHSDAKEYKAFMRRKS